MQRPISALIPAIDEVERSFAAAPEPMEDVIMVGIPMPLYRALSDAAAKKNLSFAQMLARSFDLALGE